MQTDTGFGLIEMLQGERTFLSGFQMLLYMTQGNVSWRSRIKRKKHQR